MLITSLLPPPPPILTPSPSPPLRPTAPTSAPQIRPTVMCMAYDRSTHNLHTGDATGVITSWSLCPVLQACKLANATYPVPAGWEGLIRNTADDRPSADADTLRNSVRVVVSWRAHADEITSLLVVPVAQVTPSLPSSLPPSVLPVRMTMGALQLCPTLPYPTLPYPAAGGQSTAVGGSGSHGFALIPRTEEVREGVREPEPG